MLLFKYQTYQGIELWMKFTFRLKENSENMKVVFHKWKAFVWCGLIVVFEVTHSNWTYFLALKSALTVTSRGRLKSHSKLNAASPGIINSLSYWTTKTLEYTSPSWKTQNCFFFQNISNSYKFKLELSSNLC